VRREARGGAVKKAVFLLAGAVFVIGITAGIALAEEPEIVGAPKCKICHLAKTGDQWGIWEKSKHAQAYTTLGTDEAKKIAAEKGLGDPQKEQACLKCHTTHGFLGEKVKIAESNKYEPAEGVGCEVCHGPGSEYKSKKVMEDRELAVKNGLELHEGPDHCLRCHNEESPTFKPFDFEKRWAKIAHPAPKEG
jgi:hypothetical protein